MMLATYEQFNELNLNELISVDGGGASEFWWALGGSLTIAAGAGVIIATGGAGLGTGAIIIAGGAEMMNRASR